MTFGIWKLGIGSSIRAAIVEIPVRYAETDASGVVWHGSYSAWLEVGRVHLLQALGLPYTEVESAGYAFVVTDLQARYLAPARFGDVVAVHTRIADLKSRRIVFEYNVTNAATGQLLASARTEHICVGPAGAATSIPPEWREVLRREDAGQEGSENRP